MLLVGDRREKIRRLLVDVWKRRHVFETGKRCFFPHAGMRLVIVAEDRSHAVPCGGQGRLLLLEV